MNLPVSLATVGATKHHHGTESQDKTEPHPDDPVNSHAGVADRPRKKSCRCSAKEDRNRMLRSSCHASDEETGHDPTSNAKR